MGKGRLSYVYTLIAAEVEKLQQHLSLLREQYVRLQERYTALEQQHTIAVASSQATEGEDSFVSRLLRFVAELYDKVMYLCIVVRLQSMPVIITGVLSEHFLLFVFLFFSFFSSACETRLIERMGAHSKQNPDFIIIYYYILLYDFFPS